MIRIHLMLAAIALALTGCVQAGERGLQGASPATVANAQPPVPAPYTVRVRPRIQPAGRIIAQPGDTVASVAAATGAAPREIVALNQLTPPFALRPGETILLPRPRAVVTQPGDTLYGISRSHGVDMSALAAENALRPPYDIEDGAVLRLPAIAQPVIEEAPSVPIVAASEPGPPPFLPRLAASTRASDGPRRDPGDLSLIDPVIMPPPAPISDAPPSLERVGPAPIETAASPDALAEPPARSTLIFGRPVPGDIVEAFGPEGDGVRFSASAGEPVRAVANGVIAYVGDDLPGYGRLVLVKHEDDWVSAYGQLETYAIGRGAPIARGEPVGTAGAMLWFELRRGAAAVDPAQWIEARS